MTCTEMLPAIGTEIMVNFESIRVWMRVKDVKTAWGRARVLVAPLAGTGEQWIECNRIAYRREDLAAVSRRQPCA